MATYYPQRVSYPKFSSDSLKILNKKKSLKEEK